MFLWKGVEALSEEAVRAPIARVWDKDFNYLGTYDEVFGDVTVHVGQGDTE